MIKPGELETIYRKTLRPRTNRIEEIFKNGLTHSIADVVLAWIFTVLPLLIATEVEHLGHIVKYQLTNCLPVSVCATIECNIRISKQLKTARDQTVPFNLCTYN